MNILTLDIEDWYNCDFISEDFDWDRHEARIYQGVDRTLEGLDKRNLKGMFSCLGWIVERHSGVIRSIQKQGHHIGCHSYQHELSFRFNEKDFKRDTAVAKSLIEDLVGEEVNVSRAPGLSITKNNIWALRCLGELGFEYDCFMFSALHDYGGMPNYGMGAPKRIDLGFGGFIKESPTNIQAVYGKHIVFSRGGFFCLFPYWPIDYWAKDCTYTITYFHPCDLDTGQPIIRSLPVIRRFKSYVGTKGALGKFQRLLSHYDFMNIKQADSIIEWDRTPLVKLKDLKRHAVNKFTMNILMTGVHDFVGSNPVVALKECHDLYGSDIVTPKKDGVIKTLSWDDLDKEILESGVVIRLAERAHDTKNRSVTDTYFKINTGLTQRIFDWFLARPSIKKSTFFSMVKSTADFVQGDILTEECVPVPIGPYDESKIKVENYIIERFAPEAPGNLYHAFRDGSIYPGKRAYITCLCMIHGPGNKENLNLLYNVVNKGIPWPFRAFRNRYSFTSVQNLCTVIEGLLTQEVGNGIYHMADDNPLSTNELIEVIREALGKRTKILYTPKGVMNVMTEMGGRLHLPLNSLRMQRLTENYVVSNAKAKKALGLQKMPVSVKEGLACIILSFKR